MSRATELYRQMARIRRFEETVLDNFSSGLFYGTTHTYLGQEANAVGVLSHLADGDIVFSNHRCHGHFIAYGGDLRALFAELMGKPSGVVGGLGGSQHIHWRDFYSNGVLGSAAPVATGAALAEKVQGSGKLAVIFLGVLAILDARDRGFDLAVLQAIGWRARTLLGLCMTEVLTRGVLALGLAAALAPWLARWLLGRISHANHYHMELLLPAWVFLAVCACALVLMPLSAWPAWRAARRVTPARALRILARE